MSLQGNFELEEIVIGRLMPGSSLIDGIKDLAIKHEITSGVILSVIGTTEKLTLRNPKPSTILPILDESEDSKQTDTTTIERPLEIITAEGNISLLNNEVNVHIHICCSQDGGRVYAGHLFDATIWSQGEIVLGKLSGGSLHRKFDEKTGLNQLSVNE